MSPTNVPNNEQPPTYAKHEANVDLMTPEDRLRSLQEFAETKKYTRPGEAGTLMSGNDPRSLAFGGRAPESQYTGSLAPPSYGSNTEEPKKRRESLVQRLFKRRPSAKPEGASETTK
jgi:hypothetical protein